MSFFDSEIVQEEMNKLNELQEELTKCMMISLSRETSIQEQKNTIELMKEVLEVQKLLYTRVSLSDDPDAITMKESIVQAAVMMHGQKARPQNLFEDMQKMIDGLEEMLEKEENS